jgi:hypothetical protein
MCEVKGIHPMMQGVACQELCERPELLRQKYSTSNKSGGQGGVK